MKKGELKIQSEESKQIPKSDSNMTKMSEL